MTVKVKVIPGLLLLIMLTGTTYSQRLAYQPGGGIQLSSDTEQWKFRLLGYIQSTQTIHTANENDAINNEFFVRRARLDVVFDYLSRYQIFFELDARGSRTEMVLAQFDIRYMGKHKIRLGKYITPFSPENNRSSRGLTTVERYSGLNSLFLLPGLDTQYGVMLFAWLGSWDYYLSISNGNGKASQNVRENNNFKDLQGRLVYYFTPQIHIGASVNYDQQQPQVLLLVDHTFTPFNRAAINSNRLGFLLDAEWNDIPFLLRGEVFRYAFDEPVSTVQQVGSFSGGYIEAGYFLNGDSKDGFQLIGRAEAARYGKAHESLSGTQRLTTLVLGNNFFMDGIMRLQVNLIYEIADSISLLEGTRFSGRDSAFEILSMVQVKF